jgi:hypothetical protein
MSEPETDDVYDAFLKDYNDFHHLSSVFCDTTVDKYCFIFEHVPSVGPVAPQNLANPAIDLQPSNKKPKKAKAVEEMSYPHRYAQYLLREVFAKLALLKRAMETLRYGWLFDKAKIKKCRDDKFLCTAFKGGFTDKCCHPTEPTCNLTLCCIEYLKMARVITLSTLFDVHQ